MDFSQLVFEPSGAPRWFIHKFIGMCLFWDWLPLRRLDYVCHFWISLCSMIRPLTFEFDEFIKMLAQQSRQQCQEWQQSRRQELQVWVLCHEHIYKVLCLPYLCFRPRQSRHSSCLIYVFSIFILSFEFSFANLLKAAAGAAISKSGHQQPGQDWESTQIWVPAEAWSHNELYTSRRSGQHK